MQYLFDRGVLLTARTPFSRINAERLTVVHQGVDDCGTRGNVVVSNRTESFPRPAYGLPDTAALRNVSESLVHPLLVP